MISACAVIWLEFSLFTKLTSTVLGLEEASGALDARLENIALKAFVMFSIVFMVVYFLFQFGVRGLVFADLLLVPLIALGCAGLAVGLLQIPHDGIPFDVSKFVEPILPPWQIFVFAIHVLALNSLQVTSSEPHWARAWLFGQKETTEQVRSAVLTAAVWWFMVAIGLGIAFLSADKIGPDALKFILDALREHAFVSLFFFWIAASAALFSTADSQLYSALLVYRFNAKTGLVEGAERSSIRPFLSAVLVAAVFSFAYSIVEFASLPVEKIVFVIVPFCLNIAPVFIHNALGREPNAWPVVLSSLVYIFVAAIGFTAEDRHFVWTLSAAIVPPVVGILTAPFVKSRTWIAAGKSNES